MDEDSPWDGVAMLPAESQFQDDFVPEMGEALDAVDSLGRQNGCGSQSMYQTVHR